VTAKLTSEMVNSMKRLNPSSSRRMFNGAPNQKACWMMPPSAISGRALKTASTRRKSMAALASRSGSRRLDTLPSSGSSPASTRGTMMNRNNMTPP